MLLGTLEQFGIEIESDRGDIILGWDEQNISKGLLKRRPKMSGDRTKTIILTTQKARWPNETCYLIPISVAFCGVL